MEELAVLDEGGKYYWHQDDLLGEELMMRCELPDQTAAVAVAPSPATAVYADSKEGNDDEEEGPRRRRESMVNKLISTVYSGPTISDIESALSFTGGGDHHQQLKYNSTSPVVFSPEKVLSKMENKYTLKIKTCGNNGLAEDGYKWRKYGQKSIKNSPNPRSYYRCTNPRCNAKKQVERATDEPDILVVTYEGLHLHYTYSHFLHAAQAQQQGLPKKPKRGPLEDHLLLPPPPPEEKSDHDASAAVSSSWYSIDHHHQQQQQQHGSGRDEQQQHMVEEEHVGNNNDGGLLEDVVPLLVRRPCSTTTSTSNSTSTNNSPPSSSTSSVSCWMPTSPYIDMAILSNIF